MSDEEIQDAELVDEDSTILIGKPVGMLGPLTRVQAVALFLVLLLLSSTILYVMMNKEESKLPENVEEARIDDSSVFVTDSTGASIDVEPIECHSSPAVLVKMLQNQVLVLPLLDVFSSLLLRK